MKKNSLWVCVRVKVQRSKKHQSSIKCFAMQLLAEGVWFEFNEGSTFFLSFPFPCLSFLFPAALPMALYMLLTAVLVQLGFEGLGIQPIRF